MGLFRVRVRVSIRFNPKSPPLQWKNIGRANLLKLVEVKMFMTTTQRLRARGSAGMFASAVLDHGGVSLGTSGRCYLTRVAVPCASRLMLTVFFRAKLF